MFKKTILTYTFVYIFISLFLFSGFNTFTSQVVYAAEPKTSASPIVGNSTEERVRNFFDDLPVMIEIARCESSFRQFSNNGNVLVGGEDSSMFGIYQISGLAHIVKAASLGFNILTADGNLRYARVLYEREGTAPWISSFPCWNKSSTPATSTPTPPTTSSDSNALLNMDLVLGVINPQVQILQQFLNKIGYTLATEGPGSAGNETTKFGALTKEALKRFQCAKNITCSGDEYTTGFGFANATTRTALIAAVNNSTSTPNNTEIEVLKARITELLALVASLQKQLADQSAT